MESCQTETGSGLFLRVRKRSPQPKVRDQELASVSFGLYHVVQLSETGKLTRWEGRDDGVMYPLTADRT